jgi:hypothetical protein
MIDRCKAFLAHVRFVVRSETDNWATEFHSILEQIESATRPRLPTELPPPNRS